MPAIAAPSLATRLGRFEMRRLLGKSAQLMTWLAWDPAARREVMVCLPRQPLPPALLAPWQQLAQRAARLAHPRLLPPLEVGREDQWPYAVYAREGVVTLAERMAAGTPPPAEAVQWTCDALEGLAYAHEAGLVHLDLGLHTQVIDANDHVALIGLGLAWPLARPLPVGATAGSSAASAAATRSALDLDDPHQRREAAERDVLMQGLLLHLLLADRPPLDDGDLSSVAERIGREIVRLPWTTPQPVPEPLRAIANRACDRQPRQRYLSARTLLRALQGWLEAQAQSAGGPLSALMDRVATVGVLPGRKGLASRVSRLARMEGQRLDEMVELIHQDPGLVCALLREINAAQFHGHGTGAVTSMRRAVLLMGVRGVGQTAQGLRPWPGALTGGPDSPAAGALEDGLRRACMAGVVADILCPPGTDSQETLIAAMLQSLGRLVVLYHLPDEAAQIERLQQPAPPAAPGEPETPGMSREAAVAAVLGLDLEQVGLTVVRQWGLDSQVLSAMHPLSRQAPVRKPDDHAGVMRATASAANEVVEAAHLSPPPRRMAALNQVVQRYARALDLSLKEVQAALVDARRQMDDLDLLTDS